MTDMTLRAYMERYGYWKLLYRLELYAQGYLSTAVPADIIQKEEK